MFAVHRVAQDASTSTGPIVHLLSAGASVAAQNRSGLSAAMIACTSPSGALLEASAAPERWRDHPQGAGRLRRAWQHCPAPRCPGRGKLHMREPDRAWCASAPELLQRTPRQPRLHSPHACMHATRACAGRGQPVCPEQGERVASGRRPRCGPQQHLCSLKRARRTRDRSRGRGGGEAHPGGACRGQAGDGARAGDGRRALPPPQRRHQAAGQAREAARRQCVPGRPRRAAGWPCNNLMRGPQRVAELWRTSLIQCRHALHGLRDDHHGAHGPT